MPSLAQLIVKIGADATDFQRGIAAAQRDTEKIAQKFAAIGSSLSTAFTLPGALFGGAILKASADLDALKRGLTAVAGSAQEADRQLVQLREVAKLPGLGFTEAVRGAINLQAVGFSAQRTNQVLTQFGNALATVGRGREDLDEVIRQLGQLASRGKVTADNLKPIIERVPQVAAIIKKEFGTLDTEALQKLGISSERLIQTLLKNLGELPRATGGLKNDFENLKDTITQSLAKAGDAIAPFATAAINAITPLIEKIGVLGQSFAGLPASIQNTVLAFGGLVLAVGPITLLLGKMGELKVIALAVAEGIAAMGISLSGLGIAAGVAIGIKLIGDRLLEFAPKAFTGGKALDELRGKFNAIELASNGPARAIDQLSNKVFGFQAAADKSAKAALGLDEAFGILGVQSSRQFKLALDNLNESMQAVREGAKSGAVDQATLTRATDAYNKKLHELGITINSAPKLLDFGAESGLQAFNQRLASAKQGVTEFLRVNALMARAEAAAYQERITGVQFYIEVLKTVPLLPSPFSQDSIEPISAMIREFDAFGKALPPSAQQFRIIATESEKIRAEMEKTGQVFAKIAEIDPFAAARQRKGTVLETRDILGKDSQASREAAYQDELDNLARIGELLKENKATQQDFDTQQARVNDAGKLAAGIRFNDTLRLNQRGLAELKREVRSTIGTLSSGLAQAVVDGKSLADVFSNVAKRIGADIIEFIINKGLTRLGVALAESTGAIGKLGQMIQSIFIPGGVHVAGAASGVGAAAAGAGQNAANTAGSIGSAASGGLLGAVNAISGVATAVFTALQFVQGRRMEQDIGRMEVTSRGILNQSISIQNSLNTWLPYLNRLTGLEQLGKIYEGLSGIDFSGARGGGGDVIFTGPVTITASGGNADEIMAAIARRTRQLSRDFAAV